MNFIRHKTKRIQSNLAEGFHTKILDEKQAIEFIRNAPSTSSATALSMLNYSLGYFDEFGYLPIPLVREILDNLPN